MSIITEAEVSFRALFRQRSFAVLFPAEVVSNLGSQLARFALAVLVFNRTDSATASALTYATSFLPTAVGGVVLGRLGDRFSRRAVMVGSDLVRAGLFALMAVPDMPLGVLITLLAIAVFIDPAFGSAQVSYLADAMSTEDFRASAGLRATADQLSQVAGFAVGGAVVVLVTPTGALLVDTGTFLFSAVLVLALLGEPSRAGTSTGPESAGVPERVPFAGLWRDLRTRRHMAFTVLVGLFVLPEALAVSYGHRIGTGTVQTGVLLSMIPFGSALGCALIVRARPEIRHRLTGWLAILCGLPLIASSAYPSWPISCAFWFVAGLLTGYQVEVISGLVRAIPPEVRATLLGVVSAWLVGTQGVCFALGGLAAALLGPGGVIASAAGLGAVAAVAIVSGMSRPADGALPPAVPVRRSGRRHRGRHVQRRPVG